MRTSTSAAPWKRRRPQAPVKHLNAEEKQAAKTRAARAGRRYPNLVDNMAIAAKRTSAKKTTSRRNAGATTSAKRKRSSSRRSTSAERQNPRGGLTKAGREHFARTEGAHLKPGVKKRIADMSPAEMRRKGSWAVRFYGRAGKLPPLVGENGKPTRFALTAAAWGEPVPKTTAAARRIAEKGKRLLARYQRSTKRPSSKTR